jgi:hypothetical protein
MRRKKHKHTRRSMAFYKVNYGFREPFKVGGGGGAWRWRETRPRAGRRSACLHRACPRAAPPPVPQVLLDGNFIHATMAAK